MFVAGWPHSAAPHAHPRRRYGAPYGPSQLPIFMSNVTCTGREAELSACQFSTVAMGCTHARDVGVICERPAIGTVSMRRNDAGQLDGFPVVDFQSAVYGQPPSSLVCRDGVTDREAAALCKSMGQVGAAREAAVSTTAVPRASALRRRQAVLQPGLLLLTGRVPCCFCRATVAGKRRAAGPYGPSST